MKYETFIFFFYFLKAFNFHFSNKNQSHNHKKPDSVTTQGCYKPSLRGLWKPMVWSPREATLLASWVGALPPLP